MRAYVLYHAHCPDGFGAAWAAWKALGDSVTYLPVRHHEPPPTMEGGSQVYLVDFSYPREALLALAERMAVVVVLDHHRSARRALGDLPPVEDALAGKSKLGVRFELEKSGAVLSWEFFHPDRPVPELLAYVQDKDLWTFRLPHSRWVSAALRAYPFGFETWESLEVERLKAEGEVLLCLVERLVEGLCRRARPVRLGPHRVPAVNTPLFASEVGNRLCELYPQAPFAACYSERADGRRQWELRSRGGFDVSEVAVGYGGGGHRNAAGFLEDPADPVAR